MQFLKSPARVRVPVCPPDFEVYALRGLTAALEGLQLCQSAQQREALAAELRLLAQRCEKVAQQGTGDDPGAAAVRRIADAAWQVSAVAEHHAAR